MPGACLLLGTHFDPLGRFGCIWAYSLDRPGVELINEVPSANMRHRVCSPPLVRVDTTWSSRQPFPSRLDPTVATDAEAPGTTHNPAYNHSAEWCCSTAQLCLRPVEWLCTLRWSQVVPWGVGNALESASGRLQAPHQRELLTNPPKRVCVFWTNMAY